MKQRSTPYFTLECDACGQPSGRAFADEASLYAWMAERGWHELGQKFACQKCCHIAQVLFVPLQAIHEAMAEIESAPPAPEVRPLERPDTAPICCQKTMVTISGTVNGKMGVFYRCDVCGRYDA